MAKRLLTESEFRAAVVGQDDDADYSESGWVACVFPDGTAAIGSYSHCSCYGTHEALCGGDVGDGYPDGENCEFEWSGAAEELVAMAMRIADPIIPDREADPEDYDYDHLVEMYAQVRKWAESRAKGGA